MNGKELHPNCSMKFALLRNWNENILEGTYTWYMCNIRYSIWFCLFLHVFLNLKSPETAVTSCQTVVNSNQTISLLFCQNVVRIFKILELFPGSRFTALAYACASPCGVEKTKAYTKLPPLLPQYNLGQGTSWNRRMSRLQQTLHRCFLWERFRLLKNFWVGEKIYKAKRRTFGVAYPICERKISLSI